VKIAYIRATAIEIGFQTKLIDLYQPGNTFVDIISSKVSRQVNLELLLRLIKSVNDEAVNITTLVIPALNALSTKCIKLQEIFKMLNDYGVTLHCIKENYYIRPNSTNNSTLRLLQDIAALAQIEQICKAKRKQRILKQVQKYGFLKGRGKALLKQVETRAVRLLEKGFNPNLVKRKLAVSRNVIDVIAKLNQC
jgi:DNA invertase Pin-like site-specific DNA recombinase